MNCARERERTAEEAKGWRTEEKGGSSWSPSPRAHRAPPPPYLYANELHFAILMFHPSRPRLPRKGARGYAEKGSSWLWYMFTTVSFGGRGATRVARFTLMEIAASMAQRSEGVEERGRKEWNLLALVSGNGRRSLREMLRV